MKPLAALFLLLLPLITPAQNNQKPQFKDGVEYNDYIVAEQTAVSVEIQKLNEILSDSTGTFEQAEAQRKVLQQRALLAEQNTRNLGAFKGNTELRDAAAELFHFYYIEFGADYQRMVVLVYKDDFTPDDEAELNGILDGIKEREKAFDERFATAQENFAEQNGFTLNEGE